MERLRVYADPKLQEVMVENLFIIHISLKYNLFFAHYTMNKGSDFSINVSVSQSTRFTAS